MQSDDENLNSLIKQFSNFKSLEYAKFREAMKGFRKEIPSLINPLNSLIEKTIRENRNFANSRDSF